MLFKQWNDLPEPRHQLDFPEISKNLQSLEVCPVPTVEISQDLDVSQYSRVVVTTKIMNPLFPKNLLKLISIGEIKTSLMVKESNPVQSTDTHSWNYDENFPNEIDPDSRTATSNEETLYNFSFPIYSFGKTLLFSIEENFINISPIFGNMISRSIVSQLAKTSPDIIIIGTSDRISNMKIMTEDECTLQPPEFVTGFIGSALTQLITGPNKGIKFKCLVVPSEGPNGFEKFSLSDMGSLIDVCSQWFGLDHSKYSEECHRLWRCDSAAFGAQSGLYI
ncbi:proteasome chaperone 1 [Saccharomyces pastorianus]|uniref:Proteasome chaperone 1 n=2 Tax=Saccharomyces TaxID=4930 RepID=A0A6C1EDS8_SACPS|nr:proteasome chaperone 1 [Saccharomyces pastorianus]